MKKQLLTALMTLGAVSMLCGFDNTQTVESISEKMSEATLSASSVSSDMSGNLDAAFTLSDGTTESTLDLALSGALNYDATLDPFALQMDASYSLSALGSGQSQSVQLYVVPDESGTYKAYSYLEDAGTGEGEWYVEDSASVSTDDISALIKSASENIGQLTDLGFEFTLAPEAADVDGKECYLLSTQIDSADILSLLEKSAALTGQDITGDESVAMALSMMEGLVFNLEYYVDTTTFLPVKMHMDANGSDFSTIEALIASLAGMAASEGAPESSVALAVNDASLDILFDYNTVSEITVPAEAASAAQSVADAVTDAAAEAQTEAVAEAQTEAVAE